MKGNDIDVLYTAGSSEIIQKVVFKVKRRCKESRQQADNYLDVKG